jgi:ribosomal protein S18 acetylase RimI-like enzyme
MDGTDLDVLKAIERNGVAHSVYWCGWPKMRLIEHPHAVVTESDLACPFFNNVFSADVPHSNAEPVVDELIGRFRSRNVPCFWWSGPVNHDRLVNGILEARGFTQAFEAAAMARSLAALPAPTAGVAEILEIDSESQMGDWSRTCTAAFDFDEALSGWWNELFTTLPFGTSTPLRHFLACIDGEPVGTASAFIEDGTVGLASVGVREEYRRRGIGSALTLAGLATARTLGCGLGVLFSSSMATSMYEALGFRKYGTGHCYLWSPEGDAEQVVWA